MLQQDFYKRPSCRELLELYQIMNANIIHIFTESSKLLLKNFFKHNKFYFEYIKSKLYTRHIICDLCKTTLFYLHERLLKQGFHCQECLDYNLCIECFNTTDHSLCHVMFEIDYTDYLEILLSEQDENPLISQAPSPRLCHVIKFQGMPMGLTTESDSYSNVHRVYEVIINSPAYSAGLRRGDRIVEVDMVNVGKDDNPTFLNRLKKPDEVKILVMDRETEKWYNKRKLFAKSWHSNVVLCKTQTELFEQRNQSI